ncbi:phage tail assembly protein [Uliginosibacterium gangwonense]|uniref:phage tail assembly protein n=1 Tax=Uliginosibacterium gangwonense TaxID=392736 RepID=UPI00036F2C3B|nr:phage tail assembly protein [Uliginosibacterium gangwonense]
MSKPTTATPSPSANAATVTLDTPIKRGDQVIDQITVTKPNAGALRGLSLYNVMQMDVLTLTTLLPRITTPTLTEADIKAMDVADILSLGSEVTSFFVKAENKADSPK